MEWIKTICGRPTARPRGRLSRTCHRAGRSRRNLVEPLCYLRRMRSRWLAVATLACSLSVVAGCATAPTPQPAGPMLLKAEGVARLTPPAGAPVDALVEGIARFGYRLAPTSAAENWVASPTSIAIALGMVRAGADGVTAAEIDETLGFPAAVHEAFNALTRQLVTDEVPPPRDDAQPTRAPGSPAGPTTVCIGNALFPAKNFEIKQPFLRTLAEQYGTGVYPVDFHQPAAKQDIDVWAKRQTADRIQKVFDEIDPDTALVLANTVYLRGDWRTAFEKTSTTEADFHRADGATIQVPTMHGQMGVGYAEGDGWQAVELPYGQDGKFAMRIIVPYGMRTQDELLAPEVLEAVGSGLESQLVDLAIPRWDFASNIALRDELIRLGIPSAFDADRADLSGMSPARLYLAQAVHRATITVDEFGTEAAAVTAFAAAPTSAPQPTATLHADRPFAFAIVHVPTGAPLFLGQVADPSAH
jgi:serine protease inhibitor